MSNSQYYYRLEIQNLPRHLEDAFTQFCFENGATGVSEQLSFSQPELVYEPVVRLEGPLSLSVFFEDEPSTDSIEEIKNEFPSVSIRLHQEENQDWMTKWKENFKAFSFVEPFWVVPSWCEVPSDVCHPLFIDPGMAFGTGTHETTYLAAQLLMELARLRNFSPSQRTEATGAKLNSLQFFLPFISSLDVGTGTGILALIMHHLGIRDVIGIDIDPEARRVARENILLNHAHNIQIPDQQLSDLKTSFQLVTVNIIDGVILTLKEQILSKLQPGGYLILSGILTDREEEFLEQFLKDTSLVNRRRRTKGEWSGFLLECQNR